MDRLKGIASIFPRSNRLVDIGADHGYLGIFLLKEEKVNSVWNIDISEYALANAKKNYEKEGLVSGNRFILSDGFEAIKNVPGDSIVVIAGLGSYQILKILEKVPNQICNLIILSHTDSYTIRKWAHQHGWSIRKEKYIEERENIYIAINLTRCDFYTEEHTSIDLIFGKQKFWTKEQDRNLFIKYWKQRAPRLMKIPIMYRSEDEQEALKFLKKESIIFDR